MKALAAYGAAIGASFALGPFIGGSLTELFGWRAIFLVNVPIGVAVLWITYRSVAEGRDPTPRRVDVPGQITLIGGLFLLVLALLRGNEDGWGSTGIVAALVGAAVLLIAFVVVEERSREPMLPLRLLRPAPVRRARRWRCSRSRPRSSRYSSTSPSTCRRSSACRRSRPGSSTCPAPSWSSSSRG